MDEFEPVRHECAMDGELWPGCPVCDSILRHPCPRCGYGVVFASHNPMAHVESGDDPYIDTEDEMTDVMSVVPNHLWPLYLETCQATIFS